MMSRSSSRSALEFSVMGFPTAVIGSGLPSFLMRELTVTSMDTSYNYLGRLVNMHMGHTCGAERLDEATYRQISYYFDDNFLQQKVRAAQVGPVKLDKIDGETGTMIFTVRGLTDTYTNLVQMVEWEDVAWEDDLNPIARARLLLFDGNLKLNCECPSFLYYGFQYLLTTLDNAAVRPETRPPVKRNPKQRGIVCKHMRLVLGAFPFYSADLAKFLKENMPVKEGKDKAWDMKSRIARATLADEGLDVTYGDII